MGPAGSILISVLCDAFTLAVGVFIAFMFLVLGFIPLTLRAEANVEPYVLRSRGPRRT